MDYGQKQQFRAPMATLFGGKNKGIIVNERNLNNLNNAMSSNNKVAVEATIRSTEVEGIVFYKSHNWAGKFAMNPTDKIFMSTRGGPTGVFVHEGRLHPHPPLNVQSTFYGSSGAVVYGNYALEGEADTPGGRPLRGWLLAWSALDNEHHVYVETGLLEKMINIDMDEVRKKLEKSTGTTSYYLDRTTGAEASATIIPNGCIATLSCDFGVKRAYEITPGYTIRPAISKGWPFMRSY